MAFDSFLKFSSGGVSAPEIVGESQSKGKEGWLEISEFGFGIETTLNMSSASGGAGAGKASFKEFSVKKQTDTASTALVMCCCLGGHYDQVDLHLRKSGASKTDSGGDYLIYNFKMVAVKSIDWSGSSGDDVPSEQVVFEYGAIQMKYSKQDKTGALTSGSEAMWSRIKNSDTFDV